MFCSLHYYHSTTSGIFTSNTSLTTGHTFSFPLSLSVTFLYCILIIVDLLFPPRPRQWILLCFSSPRTRRTGYANLSVRVT